MRLRLPDWFRRRPKRKGRLICMRLADMEWVHPDQIEDKCDLCGTTVGIYPSGQSVIADRGRENVEIACHVCNGPTMGAPAAPGALLEPFESVPRRKS